MNIIRVFPERTKWTPEDDLVYIGEPPLFLPDDIDEVHVSVTFSWHLRESKRLQRSWERFFPGRVRVGGPAYSDPGETFTSGLYTRKGIVFTSRGCPNRCPWCFVPAREGDIRELPIVAGNNIADNNLLACSEKHIRAVFEMLEGQTGVVFSGGLDAKLLQKWHVDLLKKISLKTAYFACDHPDHIGPIRRAGKLLADINTRKLACYVLVGFDGETITQAKRRCEEVAEAGFLPMAMYYQPIHSKKRPRDKGWIYLCRYYATARSAIRANWKKKGKDGPPPDKRNR
jgi:hypothetical protein